MGFWNGKDNRSDDDRNEHADRAKRKMTPAQRRSSENAEQMWKSQRRKSNTGRGNADHSRNAHDDTDGKRRRR